MRKLINCMLAVGAMTLMAACASMKPGEEGARISDKIRLPEVVRVSPRCAGFTTSSAQMRLQAAGFAVAGSCGSTRSQDGKSAEIRRNVDPG